MALDFFIYFLVLKESEIKSELFMLIILNVYTDKEKFGIYD